MLHGVLTIDKRIGLTSHDVVNFVRRVSGQRRVGHSGTLDPFATGVLIVALGQATRLIEYTHMLPKTYEAEITLGATSTTDDITGEIMASSGGVVSIQEIKKTLRGFIGSIQQVPPMYAAIKIKGKKLYEYARRGESIDIKSRTVTIYSLELLEYQYPKINIRVGCSTGTYIRALGRDIGATLGTGAYVSALRRTAIGKFDIQDASHLDKLSTGSLSTLLQPAETLVAHLPALTLDDKNVAQLQQGKAVTGDYSALPPHQPIAVFNDSHQLVGIGIYKATTSVLSPHKILSLS